MTNFKKIILSLKSKAQTKKAPLTLFNAKNASFSFLILLRHISLNFTTFL